MLKQRAKLVATAHAIADMAVVAASFMAAHALRSRFFPSRSEFLTRLMGHEKLPQVGPLESYAAPMAAGVLIYGFFFVFFRLYGSFRTTPFRTEIVKVTKAVSAGTLVLLALSFLTKDDTARSLLALFVTTSYVSILAVRLGIRIASHWVREQGYNFRTVLVIGTGQRAQEFARTVEAHDHWGLKLVGFVADGTVAEEGERPERINGHPVLGGIADMPSIIQKHVIDEVVMVVPRNRLEDLEDTFLLCEEAGIRTRISVNLFPHLIAKVELEEMDGVPLLTFSTTPTNELSLVVKRVIDIVLSLLLLAITAPVMLAAAILIRLEGAGPVLFRQVRIGLQGRRFVLFKFRSMVPDAEQRLGELQPFNEMDGPVFKMKDDPRVTRIGRIIRRYSVDELPQLFNVLRGDMCVVGPRPPMPEEVDHYERWQMRRLSMKPGLTCLWQVSGRNKIPFGEWMKLDLDYIDNWSLWLDVKILVRTIPMVLIGRGAS